MASDCQPPEFVEPHDQMGVRAMSPDERQRSLSKVVIVGGAGFIGSHFTDALLGRSEVSAVTIFDNFSSGRSWHVAHHADDPRLRIERGEVADLEHLTRTR